jgi:hypothetical protein
MLFNVSLLNLFTRCMWSPVPRRSTKVKQSRCTPWRRLGGEEVQLLLILDLGTRWGEWSASRPGRSLPPGKWPPVPIVQEAGWAPEVRGKILCPRRGSNPDRPVVQHVVRHYTTAWATPVPIIKEAGWAPEPVWTQRIEEKSLAPAGDRTPIAR